MTLGAKIGKKSYDLVVSPYQASILSLFNEREEITYSKLKELMKFDDETCKKQLHSLVLPIPYQ